jgi:hypothetical protein
MPQARRIVAVRIPQGNLVEPLAHLFPSIMFHFARITLIGEQRRESLAQSQPIIHLAQQQCPAITGDMGGIKGNRYWGRWMEV